ncbi:hypothetical protein [uncultured Ruminococcus sp.]|uniref:hypothetical protein n=1 Tax=uncultured Ruminococcus sp. TaxID=165186 RepID=UPI0025F7A809|nr:hypothetical protein [uncultured Ruminococcus sp.]
MKRFNFSKKFERLTSFVLALMLVLSIFTASNVAVFADTEDKNVKTKETQDQVDLYVKSSTVPCIKSSTEKNYQVMSAYANGYYSAKVNKAGTAVSSPDSADKAKYQLADFTMDDSKVYFVKPADWNSSDIKAHFWNSNGKAYDIPMDSVSNSVFLKDSKSNTVSNLTLGNNEKLYSVTIPAGMTNVIFYYNNYEYNNYEKQTNDIINISAGNCYKLTEGTTENGTIFNAESIGSVGSLNKLNKSYSFTESTVIDFTDLSAVKTLKMSDLNLKAGDTELSENSETVLEKSNDKFSVENANGFDVKVYYNNTEITSVSDIKEYDKKVSLTVKLSDIPDMTREYEVKVNSGLAITGGDWQFNEVTVNPTENNPFNVYASSSEYPLSSGKEFEVTPKFEPKLKCNGETVGSGANVTYYNSNDEEIQKLEFVNSEFTNSDSKTLKYKVSYNNYTVTGEITVNCYFVSVALASSSGSFVDEDNKIVYQKDESCSYDVKLDSNLTAKDINFSIDNGAKVDYSSSSNSNKLTISNLTKESNLTIKYPTESGFEVKKYIVKPDNKAPEITEIKFNSENAKSDDNGLYKNGDITFTIKLKDEDSGSGIYDGSLTGNDVFSCNFDQSKNVFNCTLLSNHTINGDTVFTITDRVGNEKSFSFNKLIDSGKVYVANTPITNNNFEVVSSTEKPTAEVSSYKVREANAFNDIDKNIYHGDYLTVTLDLNNDISGLQSISDLSVSGFENSNFSNFILTKINGKDQSFSANSFDELAAEFKNQATNEKVKSATVTFDIDIKDNPNYSGSHKLSLTVTDNSGNVNSGVDKSTFYVDNTAPEITKVEFSKQSSAVGKILNFLTFGIYSNDTIVMNVTALDNAPTSGLPSDAITVNGGGDLKTSATEEPNATGRSTVTYSYELGNKDSAYNLSFTVKDNANNVNENIALADLVKDNKVKANDKSLTEEQLKNVSDVFEVVSSTKEPTAEVSSYNATGTKAFNDNKNIYHGDYLTVTLDLNNDISGLQSISDLSVSGFENSNFSNFILTKINGKDQSFSANSFDELAAEFKNQATNEKVKSATVTFDIDIKDNPNYSGSHKLSLTVTDNSGNVNSGVDKSTFYVDNTAPEITEVKFSKKNDVIGKILNFLTFGIYSNDTIVMNVTTVDNAPTSGLPLDTITVKNGESVISGSSATEEPNATGISTVTYSYELDKLYNAYKLSFTVKDNAGNTEKDIDLITLIKNKKVIVNDYTLSDKQLDDISKSFEVLLTNKNDLSVVTNINGINYGDDSNIIVSGAETKVESSVNLGEDLTGAGSIGNFRCAYYQDPAAEITSTPTSYVTITHNNNDFTSTDVHQSYVPMDRDTKDQELKFDYVVSTEKSGKYVLTYTVINNAGVEKTVDKTFYVDNTAPEITKVEFSKQSSAADKILNFLTFGIYSNDTIVMDVTTVDNPPTSGLPSDAITVNGGGNLIKSETVDSNATNSSTVTYSYELGNSDSAYNLSFTVKDNANNVNENIALADLVKDNKVKANDKSLTEEQLKSVSDVFEVVSSTEKPTANIFSYNATGTNAFNDNNIYHGDQLTVTLDLNNDISGLQSISDLSVSGFENSNFSNFILTKINGKDQSFSANSFDELAAEFKNQATNEKVKSATVTFDIDIKDNPNYSGSHKLSLTVTDNSGNVNIGVDNSTFYVDNTAPEITKVEFSKQSSAVDKILNFLTFGIYSNDTIVMNVTAVDKAPTSGLPLDTITVNGGGDLKTSATKEPNATGRSTVTYSYELGNKDSAYVLNFTVKDKAGNTATKSLVDLIKEDKEKTEKTVVANANFTKVDYDKIEGFEVVSNSNSEKITAQNTFVGDVYDYNNLTIRSGDTVRVVSIIKDDLSGINKIGGFSCKWNDSKDVDIIDNSVNKNKLSAGYTYNYVTNNTVKQTEVTLNYDIETVFSGKYELKYTVTNNAGVSKTNTKTFYVDNTAPVISQFTFKNGNPAKNPDSVIKTEYGYYFKNTTTVEVTAVDGGVDSPVSGVSEIHFYTIGTDGIQSDEQIVSVSGNNQTSYKATTFEVPANFKGNVYAYAVDKAGNCYYFDTTTNKDDSQPVTPDRVVVENSSKHEQMSGIDISLPATNYVENSNKLYNNDVNVALNVSDSYSGIAKIEYSVSSEFDTDNNWDGSIKYLNDQSAETNMNGNGTVSGWKIEESDQNLVTKASSTITVKNNSNNIKIEVKLTDRAGNVSTKEETLSIDKTKPTIKIEYDNNNHTTHNGTEFYKANRTATITVTERNFSPEDVISKITNTDNVIPQITGWTTHNVANGENPDGTTHTATVVYASDGDYTFDIAFTDMAGNKADKVAQHKFTVDKTIPTINVSFDNNSAKNNNYYKADRTATITVNEHNFNAQDVKVNISATGADNSTAATAPSVSSWTSNGNIHTATVKFANDGKYAFDVNYTDLADNAAKENVVTTFYVDKTAPAVKISNVENESANSGNVAPVINLSDNNYSGDYVLTLTRVDIEAKKTDVTNDFVSTVVPTSNTGAVVTYANFASDEVNDGIYVLNAALTDKAGNSSNDTITFSVNRFGSTYMGGNKETNDLLDNGYTNAEKDIVISEINVDKLTKSNISLSLDSSSLKTLKQNVDYTVNEDAKTGQWHKYNYTVKSSNFVNEGNYTIELSSTDAAKNASTNRIRPIENRKLAVQFVVDKTAPVVNIAGIENNALYEENSKDVTVVCEDSYIDANSLVIKLDDKTLKEGKDYTVEKDVASITAKIKVNATSDISSQNIKVSVKDMAQNSGDGSVENFTLSATVLMRFFANPVLVIISAVILAGIIVMVVLIVAKKRKNN